MDNFLRKLPKVELHAHLSGSLKPDTLLELGKTLYGEQEMGPEFRNLKERLHSFNDLNECLAKFRIVHELLSTKRALEYATLLAARDFAQDHVMYVELRTTPKNTRDMTKREYLEIVINAAIKAQLIHKNFYVRVLPSLDRSEGLAAAEDTLNVVLALYRNYPDVIVAIDFGGNPSQGRFSQYVQLFHKARQNGLKVVLHCGEIANNAEIMEMLHLGMDRCGHGTFLTDAQYEQLTSMGTTLEFCMTSNIRTRSVARYADHPFKRAFAIKNAKVVLCTDDPGIFNTTLTDEYIIAHEQFILQKNDYIRMTMDGIDAAFATDDIKQKLRSILNYYKDNHRLI